MLVRHIISKDKEEGGEGFGVKKAFLTFLGRRRRSADAIVPKTQVLNCFIKVALERGFVIYFVMYVLARLSYIYIATYISKSLKLFYIENIPKHAMNHII